MGECYAEDAQIADKDKLQGRCHPGHTCTAEAQVTVRWAISTLRNVSWSVYAKMFRSAGLDASQKEACISDPTVAVHHTQAGLCHATEPGLVGGGGGELGMCEVCH